MIISRKRLPPVLLATTLSACVGTSSPTTSLSDQVNFVVAQTKQTCSFLPTAASITAILGVPGAPAAAALVAQICQKVTALPTPEAATQAKHLIRIETPSGTVEGNLLPPGA